MRYLVYTPTAEIDSTGNEAQAVIEEMTMLLHMQRLRQHHSLCMACSDIWATCRRKYFPIVTHKLQHGHVEVVKWLFRNRKERCVANKNIFDWTAANGHTKVEQQGFCVIVVQHTAW